MIDKLLEKFEVVSLIVLTLLAARVFLEISHQVKLLKG